MSQTAPFGNTRYKGAMVENRTFQDCEENIMDPIVFFGNQTITARGVRLVGQVAINGVNWGGTPKKFGLQEFEIFKDNALTGNETMENISGVTLYPNPASHVLNIKIPSSSLNSQLTITDVSGRVIESFAMGQS